IGSQLNWRTGEPAYVEARGAAVFLDQVAQPFSSNQLAVVPTRAAARPGRLGDWVPGVVLVLWISGSGELILRWFRKWWRMRAVARQATPLSGGREFDILNEFAQKIGQRKSIAMVSSEASIEPSVFGVLNPTLVWPGRLSDRLDVHEFQAILLHEL